MVEIKSLSKTFGKLEVLNGIDLKFEKSKTYAVLGPNGSGKTTLIKSILGMVLPDEGEIIVDNQIVKDGWNYRQNIGYLPQIARFPENLKVQELISMICDIRKSESKKIELIEQFELEPFLEKPLRYLSGGTRQKVNLVLALMFDSDLLIFDEPTVGLDPVSRLKFKELLFLEKQKGKTILIITHLMNEVEELADEAIYLLFGKVFFSGNPEMLIVSQNEKTFEKALVALLKKGGKDERV